MLLALLTTAALAEMRAIEPFHGVVNQSPLTVTILVGHELAVQVEGPLDRTQRVQTDVRDGVLVITLAKNPNWSDGKLPTVNLTVPTLDQVGAESAGDVEVRGRLESDDLQLWTRGAGSLTLGDVAGRTVSLVAEGAGDLRAGGVTGRTVLLASRGGSEVDARTVLGAATVGEVIGAGRLQVGRFTGERFEARVQGAGELRVVGAVDALTVSASGAGKVDLAGLAAKQARVETSGASTARIWSSERAEVDARGASSVLTTGPGQVVSRAAKSATVRAWTIGAPPAN